ncbi:MAG: ApbE family protein [Candidatus Marinimicrobia bacterium]|nr:ApbE family protein [Candidatus Neomarinimicrobiota bacterium]|tara:strand:+ start:5131 stop:5304 length:174 start_codon:yes stop_codon:yes gene_type:complete
MEFVFAILILALAFFGLSIGAIFNNKPLQGTCGGLNQQGECSICGGDPEKCEETAAI